MLTKEWEIIFTDTAITFNGNTAIGKRIEQTSFMALFAMPSTYMHGVIHLYQFESELENRLRKDCIVCDVESLAIFCKLVS